MNYLAPIRSTPGDFKSEPLIDDSSRELLEDAYQAVNNTKNGWETLARPDVPGTRSCLYCGDHLERRPTCSICSGTGTVACGFMFDTHPDPSVASTIKTIDSNLKYDGHSGASYGWTMRNVESIAKDGWEAFILSWRISDVKHKLEDRNLGPQERYNLEDIKNKLGVLIKDAKAKHKVLKTPLAVIASAATAASVADPISNPLGFFKALSADPTARAMIPDMDEQMKNVGTFFEAVEKAKTDPASWRQSAGFPYPCSCRRAQGKEGWCGVAGLAGVPACEY